MRQGGAYGEVLLKRLHDGEYELTDLFVHPFVRRKGWGVQLMQAACDWANKEKVDLYLRVCAHGKGSIMDNDALSAWYARFGFRVCPVGEYDMRRAGPQWMQRYKLG
jgi:GNAT superfamily N-acetyltransferase